VVEPVEITSGVLAEPGHRANELVEITSGAARQQWGRLTVTAEEYRVCVEPLACDAPNDVARYAALLASGTYAAAYLDVALHR
jgi:hypothetical protein